jgi:prepilin-type N-terminal cleavage/methylation domain-containing protein
VLWSRRQEIFMASRKNRGFTLLELMVTIAISLTMSCVTFMALMPLLRQSHVDAAYDTTFSAISGYRNQSISRTRRYVVLFSPPGTVTVQYWAGGVPSPAPVTVATYTLPPDMQFAVQAGFPNPGPDGFGDGTTAVAFNPCSVVEAGQPCVILMPDGSAQDDSGNYDGGVVYLTRTGDLYSSRAISVIGPSGKSRGWRLYNQSGTNTWVQQQ